MHVYRAAHRKGLVGAAHMYTTPPEDRDRHGLNRVAERPNW